MNIASKDKMIHPPTLIDYHFAGAGVHPPITIKAASREEAEAKLREILAKADTSKVEPLQDSGNK